MNPLDLLILALAVSRVTRLIVHDTITESLRTWIWRRWPGEDTQFGDSEVKGNGTDTFGRKVGYLKSGKDVVWVSGAWYATSPSFLGRVIECHWCAGIYVAIAGWAAWWFYPDIVFYLIPLALAEVLGLLIDRHE